jgi:hypothetical protein
MMGLGWAPGNFTNRYTKDAVIPGIGIVSIFCAIATDSIKGSYSHCEMEFTPLDTEAQSLRSRCERLLHDGLAGIDTGPLKSIGGTVGGSGLFGWRGGSRTFGALADKDGNLGVFTSRTNGLSLGYGVGGGLSGILGVTDVQGFFGRGGDLGFGVRPLLSADLIFSGANAERFNGVSFGIPGFNYALGVDIHGRQGDTNGRAFNVIDRGCSVFDWF